MILAYKYRIYPGRKQKKRIRSTFKTCRNLYNEMLALGIDSYKNGNVTLDRRDYYSYAKGYSDKVYSQVLQNFGDRLSKSFKNFFRRIKNKSCEKKGYPRFKSRVKSIIYPQSGFKFLSNKTIHVSKLGNMPIKLHRIPRGKMKTMSIKENQAGQFFIYFTCEVEKEMQCNKSNESSIGIDVGIKNFAVLSNGETIGNPRFLVRSENKLKKLQIKLSRKRKGSMNRRKAKLRLAKQHIKIANQRNDFLHKLSSNIASKYSLIKAESLNIKGMVKNHHLAKHINDASWNSFMQMLSYKAVKCGGQLIKVVSRNTTKTCSNCGNIQEMPLSKRTFKCINCGFTCDRDLNAAINISNKKQANYQPKISHYHGRAGLARTYTPEETSANTSSKLLASTVNEPGTTCGSQE